MSVEPTTLDRETGSPVSRFDRFTLLGLEICAMAFIVFMAYSTYGLYVGGGGRVEEARLIRNLTVALNLMTGALFGFVFFTVVRYFEEAATGYFLLIGGVVLAVVAPTVAPLVLGGGFGSQSEAQELASVRFRAMSVAMLLPGVLLVIADAIRRGRQSVRERKKLEARKKTRTPEVAKPHIIPMGKCYQTPYCRDWIRSKCPVYYARKACWRHRVGCYCDEKVILAALGMETSKARAFDLKYSRAFMVAQSQGIRGSKAGKNRCRNCFLYQFHQKEKYQILSPLVFVVVGLIVWKGIPLFHDVFLKIITTVEGFFSEATFATPTGTGTTAAAWLNQEGAYNAFFWFVAIICAVLFLSYMLQLLEHVIFKLQW